MALYWGTKLKSIVLTEWEKERQGGAKQSEYVAFMNKRVKELYDEESLEVKAEVAGYRTAKADEEPSSESYLVPGEQNLDAAEQKGRIDACKRQV